MSWSAEPANKTRLWRSVGGTVLLLGVLLVAGHFQPWLWTLPAAEHDSLGALLSRRLFLVCVWLVGASLLHQLLGLLLVEILLRRLWRNRPPKLVKDILGAVIYLGAGVGIIRTVFEVPLTGFWAMSSVFGIILGLALRPIILDFFSGLGANLERAFDIGDWIAIDHREGSHRGWIEQINWRTVRIRTRDGNILILPNSRLATSVITNYRLPRSVSRFGLRVKLELDTPVDRALRILNSAANAACTRLGGPRKEPAPGVVITEASAEGVEYWIRFWLNPAEESQDEVTHVVYHCVLEHLSKAGLSLAAPRENVFLARLPRATATALEERVQFLRRVDLFTHFQEDHLRQLAGELRLRQTPRSQCLVRAGEPGESMFLLAEGVLSVQIGMRDGETREVRVLNPGEFFGEISLLTGEPRSATVVATTDCVVFEIHRESLAQLFEQQPGLLEGLSEVMATRREADRLANSAPAEIATPGLSHAQVWLKRLRTFFTPRNED